MTDNEIDSAWSLYVSGLASDALIHAKILTEAERDRATKIIAEEKGIGRGRNDLCQGVFSTVLF